MRLTFPVFCSILAFAALPTVTAQLSNSDIDRGIALIEQANFAEAVKILNASVKRNKKEIRAWHWLGTALERQGKGKEAIRAYEKAAKVAEELQTLAIDDYRTLSRSELSAAADSAERYLVLQNSISEKKRKEWRDRADFLRFHAANDAPKPKIHRSSEVDTRVRVMRKPEPSYSSDARDNQITGTVVLRCIFGADGRVRNITVIRGLPDGLTERAIKAARQIKFIPAMKDGRPVSMWMQLEYNFNLY